MQRWALPFVDHSGYLKDPTGLKQIARLAVLLLIGQRWPLAQMRDSYHVRQVRRTGQEDRTSADPGHEDIRPDDKERNRGARKGIAG